jgi:uncharacterized protein YndB with AHSA1/START domain
MTWEFDPVRDLRIERVIRASPERVWDAWVDPHKLAQWWLPAPAVCQVDKLELSPGGGFATSSSEDGLRYSPQFDGLFLLVDPGRRLVFTNAADSHWRPANPTPVALTAEITIEDHPNGASYRAVIRHGDEGTRARHEQLGFAAGWGTVLAQLASLVESTEWVPR